MLNQEIFRTEWWRRLLWTGSRRQVGERSGRRAVSWANQHSELPRSTRWPAWHGCFMPSHSRTRSPAKALFGACSAPSAALWDEDPRLRNAVLLRLARKASRPGCSSRLRVAPLESVLFCSVLFCSVLCAGRRRHERACRWEADLRSRQD